MREVNLIGSFGTSKGELRYGMRSREPDSSRIYRGFLPLWVACGKLLSSQRTTLHAASVEFWWRESTVRRTIEPSGNARNLFATL